MITGVAIFLVGVVAGVMVFDSFLNWRINRMEDLMWEKNVYDPMLLESATTKFWVPLHKLFEQRKTQGL